MKTNRSSTSLVVITALFFIGLSLADPWLFPRAASAQTSSDTKLIPGTAGHFVGCTKPMPQLSVMQGNELDLYLTAQLIGQTFVASDFCNVTWNIERDHPVSGLPTIVVHFFKRATSANYGHISCKVYAVQHSTAGTDPPEDTIGGPIQTNDNPSDPNAVPLSMMLPLPLLQPYMSGHQPTWANAAESVSCTFGNDYVVTDIEYTESGAD